MTIRNAREAMAYLLFLADCYEASPEQIALMESVYLVGEAKR